MVLGVDPSIRECGVVVVHDDHLVYRRTLRPDPHLPDSERLTWIGETIGTVAETLEVNAIGVEAQYAGAARGNALVKLAMCAGVVVGLGAWLGVPVYLVQPSEARAALGHGRMGKEQVHGAVRARLGLGDDYELTEHEAAAVAVALAVERRDRFAMVLATGGVSGAGRRAAGKRQKAGRTGALPTG